MRTTLEYLYALQKFGMKFGLRNIRSLLHAIDDPHQKIRTIHIAGTNGKGSTSSMIAAILTAAGYKVGLYTSPHLVTFNERIRINGKMISDDDLVRYTKKIRPHVDKIHATFFEATTAIAFRYFADQKVDVAVIETGLGGRLDATNVLRPMVSVITSIGKDHTEHLGSTLRSIAVEKAGIVKRNVPVVIGSIRGISKQVIIEAAKQKGSPVVDASKLTFPPGIEIELLGNHQLSNAKSAIAAVIIVSKYLLIGDKAIRDGLKNTTAYTGLRARFEFRQGPPGILMDVAHNPDSIRALISELKKLPYKKFIVIFAVMKDKDYRSILQQFKKFKSTIIATQLKISRALPSEELFKVCKKMNITCIHAPMLKNALIQGKQNAGKNGLLVITGSHYLLGEIIPLIEKKA